MIYNKNKNNLWFTLVELIVVITILAILWTIAFLSFQWYSKSSRDSKRISDIQNIKKSLELFSIKTWKYPIPDNSWWVYLSWELVWTQWFIWDQVTTNLSDNLQKKPIDPLLETEYIYSTTNAQKEFQLMYILELDEFWFDNHFLNNTYAIEYYITKVSWTYNEAYVNTENYFVALPSIVTSEELPLELTLSWALNSQVIDGWTNIPNITWIETSTWWLDIDLNYIEKEISLESSDSDKILAIKTLQDTLSWTLLPTNNLYQDILNAESAVARLELANWIFWWTEPWTESFDILENLQDIIESWFPVDVLITWTDWEVYICDLCD